MLSVEIHSLPLKMIRSLAINVMIVNFVSSAFIISPLLITQLIHVKFEDLKKLQQCHVPTLYSIILSVLTSYFSINNYGHCRTESESDSFFEQIH